MVSDWFVTERKLSDAVAKLRNINNKADEAKFCELLDKIPKRHIDDKITATGWNVGQTALEWAAESGLEDAVTLLLSKGADVNKEDSLTKETPLHYAVRHEHPEVVKILLADKNIKIDKPDGAGMIPFHLAVEKFLIAAEQEDIYYRPARSQIFDEFRKAHNQGREIGFNLAKTTGALNGRSVLADALIKYKDISERNSPADEVKIETYKELIEILSGFDGAVIKPHEAEMLGLNEKPIPSAVVDGVNALEKPTNTQFSGKNI